MSYANLTTCTMGDVSLALQLCGTVWMQIYTPCRICCMNIFHGIVVKAIVLIVIVLDVLQCLIFNFFNKTD